MYKIYLKWEKDPERSGKISFLDYSWWRWLFQVLWWWFLKLFLTLYRVIYKGVLHHLTLDYLIIIMAVLNNLYIMVRLVISCIIRYGQIIISSGLGYIFYYHFVQFITCQIEPLVDSLQKLKINFYLKIFMHLEVRSNC